MVLEGFGAHPAAPRSGGPRCESGGEGRRWPCLHTRHGSGTVPACPRVPPGGASRLQQVGRAGMEPPARGVGTGGVPPQGRNPTGTPSASLWGRGVTWA